MSLARYYIKPGPVKFSWIGKWLYNTATFRRLGLYVEDTYDDIPVVREALNRLEVCQPDVFDLRNQRINRAYDLNYRKETLPKEQWTQYDKDIRYLTPYMAEVQREWDEKADFNRNIA